MRCAVDQLREAREASIPGGDPPEWPVQLPWCKCEDFPLVGGF
jgi:hypothetical protein